MTLARRWLRWGWLAGAMAGMAVILAAGTVRGQLSEQAPATLAASPAPQPEVGESVDRSATAHPAYSLPPQKLAKAIKLSRIRNILEVCGAIWGIVFLWLLLAMRGWARLEGWTQRIAQRRWVQGLVFFAVFVVIDDLAGLPLEWTGEHYERAYGIAVQSWTGWAGDQAKSLGLALLIGVPVLLLFNWIVRRWTRRYWLGAWVVTLPILVISIFVEPLVEPMFDKFEPLQRSHPALVAELERVVARTGTNIPPERMFLMKASEKTNGLNAYVTGIGATKRIVVWDTTAGRVPDDEVMFIFGHESGHYVLHHIPKEISISAVGLLFVYWVCAGFAAWMVRRYGAHWGAEELPSRTGFLVLLLAISIASFLLQPASSALSRHFEHQADIYGQEAIHGLVPDPQRTAVVGFNALGEAWLEDPHPNPLIEFWFFSHPSVEHRAEFAEHYNPWANGGHGEFLKK